MKNMRLKGFTLIETVIVVALTGLIMVTLAYLIVYFYRTNTYTLEEATAVSQARRGVRSSMEYLREASYGSDGSYPIQTAATSTLTFFADINGSSVVEKVTYIVLKGTFYETVTTPAGNPLSYVGQTPATSTLATSIVNSTSTPIFRYFDNTGAELTAPITLSQIASVSTTVVVDVNTSRAPVAYTLTSGATLRNLKDQQ